MEDGYSEMRKKYLLFFYNTMTTITKPITKFITLDKPFDIKNEFSHKKKKPTGVMLIMIPQYSQDIIPIEKVSHNNDISQFT